MKYYKLTHNGLDKKQVGIFPQSTESFIGDIQQSFIPFEGPIHFDFDLPVPKLQNKAKPTTYLNVISIPSWFLVIKKYFIEFLKDFNIGNYQVWDIKVEYKKSVMNDYCLFILTDTKQNDYIDFIKSEFYIGKTYNYKYVGDTIKIIDHQNYLSTREVLKEDNLWLKCRKGVLDLRKAKEDMFRLINAPIGGYYVSERLKNAIREKGYTGMDFKEIEEYDKKIKVIY